MNETKEYLLVELPTEERPRDKLRGFQEMARMLGGDAWWVAAGPHLPQDNDLTLTSGEAWSQTVENPGSALQDRQESEEILVEGPPRSHWPGDIETGKPTMSGLPEPGESEGEDAEIAGREMKLTDRKRLNRQLVNWPSVGSTLEHLVCEVMDQRELTADIPIPDGHTISEAVPGLLEKSEMTLSEENIKNTGLMEELLNMQDNLARSLLGRLETEERKALECYVSQLVVQQAISMLKDHGSHPPGAPEGMER